MYAVDHKICHFIFDYVFVPLETEMNTVLRSYKMYSFTLTVSVYYILGKIKKMHTKTADRFLHCELSNRLFVAFIESRLMLVFYI